MKESIGTKIFKQFYNISGPIDEYKRTQANTIGNTVAIMLYWFNVVISLLTIIIGGVTKDYLLAFFILSGTILIFTIFIAGSYVMYAGHKYHLADQEVEKGDIHAAYRNIIFKSLKIGILGAIFAYFLNAFVLYLYFGNFIRQLSDPSNIVACITCGVTVTLLLLLVYYLRIKKVK